MSYTGDLTVRARAHFDALTTLYDAAVSAFAAGPDGAAARAEAAEIALRLHDFVQHHEMLDRMQQTMGELSPDERKAVRAALTPSEYAVVSRATAREAEYDRERDPGWER